MYTLRLLGSIGLSSSEGEDVDAILRQPKRTALLAYLSMPVPGTWHRRDTIFAMFWPEHDQVSARTVLRSTIYGLRRQLPPGAIRARGDDELGVDPGLITTDVAEMIGEISAGAHHNALEKYKGEFLAGLHVADSAPFEKWLDSERRRLRRLAAKEASSLADDREGAGDTSGAVEAAQRASELDPDDEAAARRWIAALDRAGDRSQAFAVYQRFRNHMSEEFGVRPSAETVALVDAVRLRHTVPEHDAVDKTEHQPETDTAPAADAVLEAEPAVSPAQTAERATLAVSSFEAQGVKRRSRRLPMIGLMIPVLVLTAWALVHRPSRTSGFTARRLVVLPVENETGDKKLDYIGSGVAEGVAMRLEGIGGLTIRSGVRSDWPEKLRHDYKAIGRDFGATILLRSTLARVGDSLEMRMSAIDAATSGERIVASRRFATSQLVDLESGLAAAVAGAVFRVPLPEAPRVPRYSINPESYRLTLDGFHQLLQSSRPDSAKQLFLLATSLDPRNARAWSGLSSVWANQAFQGTVPWDVAYDRSSAAAARALALDSLEGSSWANLAFLRSVRYQSLRVGSELMRKAVAAEPGNPEIFLVKSAMLRQAQKWDEALDAIRVARSLDPLSSRYADREAFTDLCADRPQLALSVYETQLRETPRDKRARQGRIRSLARLGRYDDAIATWRRDAQADGDTAMVRTLTGARGRKGFWSAKHVEQEKLLAISGGLTSNSAGVRVQARFASGDIDGGFAELEHNDDRSNHYLPCGPGFDEVRTTPRFKAIAARNGPMPDR